MFPENRLPTFSGPLTSVCGRIFTGNPDLAKEVGLKGSKENPFFQQ
jgi:hypothetical protein